jgi:hypothetical protein
MHKNATKCNETLSKWCKNKHGASKIIDTLETYHSAGKNSDFSAAEACRDRDFAKNAAAAGIRCGFCLLA